MPIQFENCPVVLKPQVTVTNVFEDAFVVANSVQLNDNLPMVEIRRLGREGGFRGRPESPVQGQLSLDFVYGKMSVSLDGTEIHSPLKSWFDNLTGVVEYIDASIGPYQFSSGLLTDFSFSSEPNSVINASASFVFYNSELSKVSNSIASSPSALEIGHGVYSSGNFSDATIGLNDHPFAFSYSISQNFEPIRYAGDVSTAVVKRIDGQITVDIEGDDLANGLTSSASSLCKERINDATFNITGLCNGSLDDQYAVKGYIENRDISVSEGDIVRGSLTVIDYF